MMSEKAPNSVDDDSRDGHASSLGDGEQATIEVDRDTMERCDRHTVPSPLKSPTTVSRNHPSTRYRAGLRRSNRRVAVRPPKRRPGMRRHPAYISSDDLTEEHLLNRTYEEDALEISPEPGPREEPEYETGKFLHKYLEEFQSRFEGNTPDREQFFEHLATLPNVMPTLHPTLEEFLMLHNGTVQRQRRGVLNHTTESEDSCSPSCFESEYSSSCDVQRHSINAKGLVHQSSRTARQPEYAATDFPPMRCYEVEHYDDVDSVTSLVGDISETRCMSFFDSDSDDVYDPPSSDTISNLSCSTNSSQAVGHTHYLDINDLISSYDLSSRSGQSNERSYACENINSASTYRLPFEPDSLPNRINRRRRFKQERV